MHLLHSISGPLLIWSGLIAYIVSSWLLVLLRRAGATAFSPRVYWACGLFGSTRGAAVFAGRVLRVVAFTIVVPLPYIVIFEFTRNAGVGFGAALGILHAIVVGITLPIIASRARCRGAPQPGLFGWRLGRATPLLIIFVYALYGAALGYVYVIPSP